jgi:hypothetical protein
MSMIQYYISSIESDKVQFTEEKKQIKKPRVVFNDKKTESVKSTITKEPSAEEFFGM